MGGALWRGALCDEHGTAASRAGEGEVVLEFKEIEVAEHYGILLEFRVTSVTFATDHCIVVSGCTKSHYHVIFKFFLSGIWSFLFPHIHTNDGNVFYQ